MAELSELELIKASVRSLIQSAVSSFYTIVDLKKDYEKMMGESLPLLGYHNIEHLLRAMPDVVRIKGHGNAAILTYVPTSKSQHIGELVKNQKNDNRRRRRTARPFRTDRAVEFPHYNESDSDWDARCVKPKEQKANDVVASEQEMTALDKNVSQCSNRRFEMLLELRKKARAQDKNVTAPNAATNEVNANATNANQNRQPRSLSIFQLLERIKKEQNEAEAGSGAAAANPLLNGNLEKRSKRAKQLDDDDEAVPAYAVTELITKLEETLLSPAEERASVPRYEMTISQHGLSDKFPIKDIQEIVITVVKTPWDFHFLLTEEAPKFEALHKGMQDVYKTLARSEACLPSHQLYAGRLCAAYYKESWHRANVEAVPNIITDFSKIKVLLLDRGIYCDIKLRHLKHLQARFAYMPPQLFFGKLSCTKLKADMPIRAASQLFHQMVINKPIYGCVTSLDLKKQQVELALLDDSIVPKRVIHKELIKSGLVEEA